MCSCCCFSIITNSVNNNFDHLILGMNFLFEELIFSLIRSIFDKNFLSLKKNNNGNFHSKLFDLFNNNSKITNLLQRTLRFAEPYSDTEDTSL